MGLELKLSDIQAQLPEAGRRWIAGMSSAERHSTEIILNNVGVEILFEILERIPGRTGRNSKFLILTLVHSYEGDRVSVSWSIKALFELR